MEERLFWIGMGMGAYIWGTQQLTKKKALDRRLYNALWHALFWMGAAFGLGMVLAMSFESRGGFGPFASSGGSFTFPLLFSAGAGIWSFWRGYSEGRSADARQRFGREDLEWGETIFSAVLLAAFLMYFVLQAFKIPSGSMRSTLEIGDHLFVNKFIYGVRIPLTDKRLARLRPVQRGDIAVFEFPTDDPNELHCGSVQSGKDFIKRVIGLPGDTIEVRNGNLLVNGVVQEEPYTQYVDSMRIPPPSAQLDPATYQATWQTRRLDKEFGDRVRDFFGPVRVPPGTYFMMGDNRDQSCDSRFWGPVQDRYVKGKAWFVYWPIGRMRTLK